MNKDSSNPPKNEYLPYRIVDAVLQQLCRKLPLNRWTEHLALQWGFRYRGNRKAVRLFDGQRMYVDPTDYLQCLIYYFGVFEPHCMRLLQILLQSDETFIDIGGNIGLYTIVASKLVGNGGRVLTFEAAPFHCQAIRENITLNELNNVVLYETALGAEDGSTRLVLPEGGNEGMFTLAAKPENHEVERVSYRVNLSRFNSMIKWGEIKKLSLVKLDIEGAEPLALEGMHEIFDQFRCSVIIEINELSLRRLGQSSTDLIRWFSRRHYQGWAIGSNGKLCAINVEGDPEAEDLCHEYLFVHSENSSHLDKIASLSCSTGGNLPRD
jgi:FkbM family methyltransferase